MMFNNHIKKFITTVAVAAVTFGVFAPFNNHATHAVNSTVHADTTVAADGPWETTNDGSNLPEIQQVHNGNQIYYSIKPGDRNTKLFQQSVANWNALGVIDLVQVNWGDQSSEIAMASAGWSKDNAYGDTNSDFKYTDGTNTAIMTNATITLYKNMKHLSNKNQQVTSDHELGHALGFAHDRRKLNNGRQYKGYHLTMYPYVDAAHYYKLGGIEQRTLADHYDLAPSNGYLDTNC